MTPFLNLQVEWRPYDLVTSDDHEVVQAGSDLFDHEIWLICLGIIIRYSISRATCQLGQRQGLPLDVELVATTSLRGAPRDTSFETAYKDEVAEWKHEGQSVSQEVPEEEEREAWTRFI